MSKIASVPRTKVAKKTDLLEIKFSKAHRSLLAEINRRLNSELNQALGWIYEDMDNQELIDKYQWALKQDFSGVVRQPTPELPVVDKEKDDGTEPTRKTE